MEIDIAEANRVKTLVLVKKVDLSSSQIIFFFQSYYQILYFHTNKI